MLTPKETVCVHVILNNTEKKTVDGKRKQSIENSRPRRTNVTQQASKSSLLSSSECTVFLCVHKSFISQQLKCLCWATENVEPYHTGCPIAKKLIIE